MDCPSCAAHVIGADCPRCAVTVVSACPDCNARFQSCDVHCRSCGRELRFINFSNHTVLRKPAAVRVEQYEHPADREARRVMAGLWPVKVIARYGIETFSQPTLHGTLLGSTVKVSDKQFPVIKRVADVCMAMLHMRGIEIFISRSAVMAASSHGVGGRNFIVLTSGLVENLDDDELLFLLGRQMGHIKSDHTLYLSILAALQKGIQALPMVGDTALEVLNFVLLPWQRSSQLTADRAGLICCQSIQTATKALTKLALGSRELFDKVCLDEFLRQYQDLQNEGAWGEYMQVNPFVLTRIRQLQGFIESPAWYRLLYGAYHPHRPTFGCYYCNATYELTDFDAPLQSLRCTDCGRTLHVEELFCPHCGTTDRLAGESVSCAGFTCSSCHRPYFLHDERRLAEAWNGALPEDCAYATLRVPFNASPERLAQGYVAAMRPADGRPLAVERRIAIDKAYRTLLNTRRRIRHDASLHHRLCRNLVGDQSEPLVDCPRCGVTAATTFCGHCGASADPATETRPDHAPAKGQPPSAELTRLKEALAGESAFGDGIVFFTDAPFDVCFKVSPHVFHVAIVTTALTTPGVIRQWLDECNRRSELIARQSWLHAAATFVLVVLADVDEQLVHNLGAHHFVARRGVTGVFQLDVLVADRAGGFRLSTAPPPVDARTAPSTFAGYGEYCNHLAQQVANSPSGD